MQKWSWTLSFFLGLSAAQAALVESRYTVATEPGHLMLNSVDHWDSESASDFVVYQRPLERDAQYLRSTKIFDLSVGSISSKQFLKYQRLKVEQDLTENLQVRLHWLEARDFEQDRSALPLELSYRLNSHFALSIFGQPSLYKAEDDVGVSGELLLPTDLKFSATALWGDFQRNQRNLDADRWSQSPVAYTLSAQWLPGDRDFYLSEIHYEPHSERSLNGTPTHTLGFQMLAMSGLHSASAESAWGYRAQADQAFHSDHSAEKVRLRQRILSQLEYSRWLGAQSLRPGLNFFYRENRQNAETDIVREVLPTVWVDFRDRNRSWGRHSWALGYDGTVFDRDSSLQNEQRRLEHRGNLKSTFSFSKSGQLALLFTVDLDRLGSGETWEGGAAQFHMEL